MKKVLSLLLVLTSVNGLFAAEQYVLKTSATVEVLDNGRTVGTKVLSPGTIVRVIESEAKKSSVDIIGEEVVFNFGRGGCFAKSEELSRNEKENWVFDCTTRPAWIRALKLCHRGFENELPKGNTTGGTSHSSFGGNATSYSFKVYVEENNSGKTRMWTLPVTDQNGDCLFSLKIIQEG